MSTAFVVRVVVVVVVMIMPMAMFGRAVRGGTALVTAEVIMSTTVLCSAARSGAAVAARIRLPVLAVT
ncbi:MAG: hypothetical protein ACTHNZ_10075 [Trinickia sp.]|uniref:hypothetical protein n=1 Tax=Trinickia sp. TaxID=2571163 RepID=UPI003F8069EA